MIQISPILDVDLSQFTLTSLSQSQGWVHSIVALVVPAAVALLGSIPWASPILGLRRGQWISQAPQVGVPGVVIESPPGTSRVPKLPRPPLVPALASAVMSATSAQTGTSPVIMTATMQPQQSGKTPMDLTSTASGGAWCGH